jgi:hypothetical protein
VPPSSNPAYHTGHGVLSATDSDSERSPVTTPTNDFGNLKPAVVPKETKNFAGKLSADTKLHFTGAYRANVVVAGKLDYLGSNSLRTHRMPVAGHRFLSGPDR